MKKETIEYKNTKIPIKRREPKSVVFRVVRSKLVRVLKILFKLLGMSIVILLLVLISI